MNNLESIAKLIRYYSLVMSTEAGSGHPSSSLSAADLMTGLLFGGTFRYDLNNPFHPNNDRLIFSKGHASPLFYSLWAAAGKVTEKELVMRYYRERALPHLVPFPARVTRPAGEPIPEGLETWDLGAPVARIDWPGTLTRSRRPLLANDPHLDLSAPSVFYPLRLRGLQFPEQAEAARRQGAIDRRRLHEIRPCANDVKRMHSSPTGQRGKYSASGLGARRSYRGFRRSEPGYSGSDS